MKGKEEQLVCIKFCIKLGKTFTETLQVLQKAFEDEYLNRSKCTNGLKGSKTKNKKKNSKTFFVPKNKKTDECRRFDDVMDIKKKSLEELKIIPEKRCWEKCIVTQGEYLEGDTVL